MKTKKVVHKGYTEFLNAQKRGFKDLRQMFGKYQYLYSHEKNTISLVCLKDYWMNGKDIWEIYCVVGSLFEDVERFDTKKEAEVRIKQLFGEKDV